ncbi:MAG: glycosyltransferase family 2 protein [Candidatus Roizmanbacteria bacterium]|nr:MAG: glycosyltransferase family 2 protein [Candidatus Roizmanbacteria bacterium]
MNKKVSIIITAYNEKKNIKDCLLSLKEQDYQPLEILTADDGSTDGTYELIKSLGVACFRLSHQGTAKSRNYAAKKATGEILVFLDADMHFEKNFITKLVEPINESRTKGTFSRLEYVSNWDKPLARCWNRNNNPPLPDKLRIPQDKEEGDDFRAILKSEFERVGGFNNVGYTDTWTLSKKLGYKPINAPGAIYFHNNPETYSEVINSSQWIGKRQYRLGKIGSLIAIIRSFILFSLFKGIVKALKYKEATFIPFQIIYDLGITAGAFRQFTLNEVKK